MNALQLIARTRVLIDADSSVGSGPFDDGQILGFVDNSLKSLWAHQVDVCPNFYLETATTTELGMTFTAVAVDQYRARLPRHVYQIVRVDAEGSSSYNGRLPHLGFQASAQQYMPNARSSMPCGWFVGMNNTLYVQGGGSANAAYRIWFVRRQPELLVLTASEGSTTSFVAAIGDEVAGSLRSNADWYVGSRFEITSASGALPEGEEVIVTDYAPSSAYPDMTFTIEEISAAIDEGDTLAMVPIIDEASHELVCYLSALRAMDRTGNDRVKAMLGGTAKDLWEKWIALARRTQLQDEATILHEV